MNQSKNFSNTILERPRVNTRLNILGILDAFPKFVKLDDPDAYVKKSKKASELYGLTFDNKLDNFLGTGLKGKTLTYLYGKRVIGIVNLLALNSVRQFGGRVFFTDAGNAADPYLIRRESDLRMKDSAATSKLLKSINLSISFMSYLDLELNGFSSICERASSMDNFQINVLLCYLAVKFFFWLLFERHAFPVYEHTLC